MKAYYYLFDTAGIQFVLELPLELVIREETAEFTIPLDSGEADRLLDQGVRRILFEQAEQTEAVPAEAFALERRAYWSDGSSQKVFFKPEKHREPYAEVIWEDNEPVRCIFTEYGRGEIRFSNILVDLLSMETLLLNQGGFLLHCCLVDWQGRGILFSAPSGTGKSTQGALWTRFEGARIINGDRAGLVREKGRWMAYGLPYAGSSNEYLNEKVPVDAIVYLSQADTNVIAPMLPSQILKKLYPEITIHHWDRAFVEKATGTLISMIGEIPFYHLSCLPDKGAVDVLKEVIAQ